MSLSPGTQLGPYKILAPLGAGGMGEVYRAHDTRLGRDVAVKVLPPHLAADPERRRRFAHEARATAALAHPNILVIYDVGEHDGAPYLAMELLDGETLRKRLAAGALPAGKAVEIAMQIARGLAAASEKGIIHRDLKPENLFLTRDGVAKILDFGLARLTQPEPSATDADMATTVTALTGAGEILGTMGYLAPEQVRGEPADARSDVFAFGCVLYEMLSGRRAFPGASPAETLSAILRDEPPPVAGNDPMLPSVEGVARRCLSKRPEERYQTAREIGSALEVLVRGSVAKAPGRIAGTRRGRAPAVLLGVTLLVLALGGVAAWQRWGPFSTWPPGPSPHAPGQKDWILVAEFEGPPGDSTLAPAARSLLSAALDQSEIVATVSRDQIQEALEAAGRPKDSRVDAALAKELAYRSAVRAVLEGSIGRIGSGYSIVLRVVNADSAKVILTSSGTARDEDALIPALGDLAKELRKGLGENRRALQATRAMALVSTPSFEAYRLYVEARLALQGRGDDREALRLCRTALELDPDFASAWAWMAAPYMNEANPDSALACINEALSRPERLTHIERRRLEIFRAINEGDFQGALAGYNRILMDDPSDLWALTNGNGVVTGFGRFEEAFERTSKAMQLSPFGPSEVLRANHRGNLYILGRFDEAREVNQQMNGITREWNRAQIELAAGQLAAAESIALANLDQPGRWLGRPCNKLASARFGRGAVAAASQTLERCEEMCGAASDPLGVDVSRRLRIKFFVLSDGTMTMPRDAWANDTTTATILTRGMRAAITGDETVASRCLEVAREHPHRKLVPHGAALALLQARIETLAGRPEEAVRLLRPIAVLRTEPGWPADGPGLTWVRWFLADAFEKLDRPDSAAVYLERIWDIPFLDYEGAEKPWVHRRLALLYARMGRIPDAERHLAAAVQAFDRPDPEVQMLLSDARVAVAVARGRAER